MKKRFQVYAVTVGLGVVAALALAYILEGLNQLAFVFLLAILAAVVYFVIFCIQRIRARRTASSKQNVNTNRPPIVLGVLTVCLGIMVFTGQLYSLYMTVQMPKEYSYGYNLKNPTAQTGEYKLYDDWPPLDGDKAVTLNINFGAYSNGAMRFVANITDFPREKLFKYSNKFIPVGYLAHSRDDVGYLVVINHRTESAGEYTSGAKAYRWYIDIWICDDEQVLSSTTIKGGARKSTTLHSGAVIGRAPDNEAREWVAAELTRLIGN